MNLQGLGPRMVAGHLGGRYGDDHTRGHPVDVMSSKKMGPVPHMGPVRSWAGN